jgi:hypothetical protein
MLHACTAGKEEGSEGERRCGYNQSLFCSVNTGSVGERKQLSSLAFVFFSFSPSVGLVKACHGDFMRGKSRRTV